MALQAPVDYYGQMANVPDPGQKFEEGMAWAQKQKELEKARARQAQMEADYEALLSGQMTQAKLRDFTFKYPEVASQYKGVIDSLGEDEKKAAIQQFIPAATALYSGNQTVAEQQLRTTAEAYANSGNTQMAKMYSDAAESIKISPDQANVVLSMMANFIDPEWAGKVDTSRKTGADIVKTGAETRGLTADAIVKEVQAKYAPDKIAAELNLTEAQTLQAKAAAGASSAAARKSDAEATNVNSALIPLEKRPELELKLRGEYAGATKEHRDVKSAYGRVLASQATAAGDLALIFNYMKMLDPGSAVREGEFANAQNSGSVSTTIRNMYNKLLSGERLSESQRKMFSGQAKSLYDQSAKGEATVRTGLTRIATGYGLSPTNIFYEEVETTPTAPAAPAAAAAAAPAPAVVPPRGSPMAPVAVDY